MKTYDILLLKNHVYIGMEDVSVTYRQAEKKTNLSAEDAKIMLTQALDAWNNDETVIRERENAAAGRRSYYPNQYETPCIAMIAENGILNDCYISNYNDIRKANQKGATDISFSKGLDAISAYFD